MWDTACFGYNKIGFASLIKSQQVLLPPSRIIIILFFIAISCYIYQQFIQKEREANNDFRKYTSNFIFSQLLEIIIWFSLFFLLPKIQTKDKRSITKLNLRSNSYQILPKKSNASHSETLTFEIMTFEVKSWGRVLPERYGHLTRKECESPSQKQVWNRENQKTP